MKKIALIICSLCAFLQYAVADGYQLFHDAQVLFSQGKYSQAKTKFELCLRDPMFANVKDNINYWINKSESAIQEYNKNAKIAADRQKKKLAERKSNQYVYISVNAAESGTAYSRTVSAMSEVMRKNGRQFCPNIDDALTVVTVSLDIKDCEARNGFYKATGYGVLRLGSAIDANEFVGQWSVDCEATSALNADDAQRLLLNKLNHKLGYALDNLLNGRSQESGHYIPEQSISIYFAKNNVVEEDDLSFLRKSLGNYISKAPGVTLSTALDETMNEDLDEIAKIQAEYVKMESRAPIHELEGFSQVLRISVQQDGDFYTFAGELTELATGKSLTTVTIDGADFNIKDISAKNQEFVAKVFAVGLGFKSWSIGEDIGGYKLASYDGIHGLVLRVVESDFTGKCSVEELSDRDDDPKIITDGWRFPNADELLEMVAHKRVLGLKTAYWTGEEVDKRVFKVVDFKENAVKTYKYNKMVAAVVLVKEF